MVSRPFATDISLAKHSLRSVVNDFYSSRYKLEGSDLEYISKLNRPESKGNKTISDFKMALAKHKVEYHSISNYLFSAITKNTLSYLSKLSGLQEKEEHHLNWLLVDLDLLFFIHAMDIRIRPTDRLGRFINDVIETTSNWPENYKDLIHKKIFDHIKQAMNIFINYSNDMIGLETLNLLIILTMLPAKYQLHESKVEEYLEHLSSSSNTNDFYFIWVTCMLYIGSKDGYEQIRSNLIQKAETFLLSHPDMFISAEYFMFYFDYLACPHIDPQTKSNMLQKVKNKTWSHSQSRVNFNVRQQAQQVLHKDFIVCWRDSDYLKSCLKKKEYLFSYD